MHAVILGLHFDKKMNLSKKVHQINEAKLICNGKETTLNPNAAEFIPVALKSPGNSSVVDATTKFGTFGTPGKVVLDRSESSISNNSDEEARQYWSRQLPDDITPDFKVVGENESQGLEYLSLVGMSLHDTTEQLRVTTHTGTRLVLNEQQESAPHHINGNNFIDKMGYSISTYGEDSDACFMHLPCKPWDKQIVNNDHLIRNSMGAASFNGDSRHGYISDMFSEHEFVDENEINHLDSLAAQFPGFAAESLADVYYANQCDMNLTVEMLTQLELQGDGGFDQNLNSKTLLAPNLSALDFPALPASDSHHGLQKFAGDDLQQSVNPYRASGGEDWLMFKSGSSNPSKGATDFASAVKKLASQDSGIWKYDKQSSADGSIGSSKSSHVLTTSCNNGHGRAVYADRLRNRGSVRAPVWVATGEAVASMYSELREEARDHARLRNAYFEQATQAYLIGNKALAKELSAKGQLHNMHMKAAHGKAQESIYHQRNPGGPQVKGNGKGQERMIDLHGLHVSEAIHVLKLELGVLRSAAKSASQPLQIYICVGTGHHTRGSRTPARLPVAVQRHLLEEEGLDYTEPQPGLLRVVIY